MIYGRKALQVGVLIVLSLAFVPNTARAQQDDELSCAERMTEQLRRFNEKCLSDLVTYVTSQAGLAAKISAENEKYYVKLARNNDGLVAEAVSKFNYPLMKDDVASTLKQLGWIPPENESDNWKKLISSDDVKNGVAAEDIAKALAAYGLKKGEAIAVTIGAQS
jgi:hypothetical protein